MIEFYCQNCYEVVSTPDETAGKKGRCPHCREVMQIPTASQSTQSNDRATDRSAGERSMPSARGAGVPQREADDDLFRVLEQPDNWGTDARASRGTTDPRMETVVSGSRKNSPQRRAAHVALRGPALGLMILSGLALVGTIAFFLLWSFVQSVTTGLNIRGKEVSLQIVPTLVVMSLLAFVQCIVLAGASEMWRVGKYGFCVTAAIIAILPCGLTPILGAPFGVWALVVLMRADVRRAFR